MADSRSEMKPQSVDGLLDLLFTLERLKLVDRQNPLRCDRRQENSAEHSWSVALAVLLFQSLAVEEIDVGHAIRLAVVHDLPEVFVGDTFVYGIDADSRPSREYRAMELFREAADFVAPGGRGDVVDLWMEYEAASTPESRYVLALDVLLPVFMNGGNLEMSSWKRHGVEAESVRARVRMVEQWLPSLAGRAYESIEEAVRHGVLRGD